MVRFERRYEPEDDFSLVTLSFKRFAINCIDGCSAVLVGYSLHGLRRLR